MADRISEDAKKVFDSDSKVGLVAVTDDEGCPHITLLSTLGARSDHEIMFGSFCEGISKKSIARRPKAGFLLLSLNKELWRGKAVYTGSAVTGPEFDRYNDKPLFRYNSYFGIGKVWFLDLAEISDKDKLGMGAIVAGALATRALKGFARGHENGALNHNSKKLIAGLSTLKFLSVEGEDGFCTIIPIVQASPIGSGRLAFTANPYRSELMGLKPGSKAAVFCLTLDLVSVLVKGEYKGIRGGLGVVDIEKVYNPCPPLPGYVFPREELKAVTDFS